MKPLLIGEANPYSADPRFALYPEPTGSAGYRLCYMVLRLEPRQYLRAFDRVDLCDTTWDLSAARARAEKILAEREGGTLVLLGEKVSRAFDVDFEPYTAREQIRPATLFSSGNCRCVILPHPSGACRLWQKPEAFSQARKTLRAAGIDLPARLAIARKNS